MILIALVVLWFIFTSIESQSWTNGNKVGSFQLDSVNGNMVKIGCHNIDLNEAKSVLNSISTFKLEGDK
jgi:hypothetical protein